MPSYTPYPLVTDREALIGEWLDEIQSYWPNYVPSDSQLAFRAASALIGLIAEGRDVAALIPDDIFRTLGAKLHGFPANAASAATADTTWTARDDAGYGPVDAGTLLSVEGQYFETVDEFSFPSGTTVVTPVSIVAVDEGAASSELGVAGTVADLQTQYEFVASITLNGATSGGADEEDIAEYMSRLRTLFTLLTAKPIGASDLATLAQTVTGVEAALALKGYNPADDTFGNEGYAAVAVKDVLGGLVPTFVKDQVTALLTGPSDRLVNTVINVIDPTWTNVDVTWTAVGFPGADTAEAVAAGNAALALALDPAGWGQPPSGERRLWVPKSKVSKYDLGAALDGAEQIDRVTALTIGLAGGAQTEADHDLPGVAPLPRPGTISGTVTLP